MVSSSRNLLAIIFLDDDGAVLVTIGKSKPKQPLRLT